MGTIQPHDNALVVILWIGGYDVKRVMVDKGSGAEIMYPDLYKGMSLKLEDPGKYDIPLVGFDGRLVILKRMIRLQIHVGKEVVKVDFIIVDTYSPHTIILVRTLLHAMGAVSSTLHMKVKFSTKGHIGELQGCQDMARWCMVVVVKH